MGGNRREQENNASTSSLSSYDCGIISSIYACSFFNNEDERDLKLTNDSTIPHKPGVYTSDTIHLVGGPPSLLSAASTLSSASTIKANNTKTTPKPKRMKKNRHRTSPRPHSTESVDTRTEFIWSLVHLQNL
mmetsp:Transcript_5835/g.12764  ORF Transcript_5835/g.12764 Transcript_5835/m.12764 type:complete len:132 (+) Transcript_5835:420-815(+)